jgi:hypothetical protein
LYNNELTGSIPSNLQWNKMNYLDLGHNQLTGTIPKDWVDTKSNITSLISLKSIYLDHNLLNGSLPDTWYMLGSNSIEQIIINNNLLTGVLPTNKDTMNYNLTTYAVQNNSFTRIDREFCKQSIYVNTGGMLAIFNADCDICVCDELCTTYCGDTSSN